MTMKPSLDWMQAALDGELSPEEQARLERELSESPEARAQWLALVEVAELIGHTPMAAPRTGFARRFQARLAERRSKKRVVGGALILGLAAPVGITVMGMLVVGTLLPSILLASPPSEWMTSQVTGIGMGLADVRAVLDMLATGIYLLASWALSQPLTWLALVPGGAVVAAWLYVIRKMNLEVSLS